MSTRVITPLLCAILLAACGPRPEREIGEPEPAPLTASHLANLIAADGARHTILVLTGPADPTGIDKVFAGIATGDPEWLALAPAIEPEIDGRYADCLQDALRQALPRNPSGVLSLMPAHGKDLFVCAPADLTTRALIVAVTDPALQEARDRCLRYMDADETELAAFEAG